MAVKYSKQREEIKAYLSTRKDHPTADQVYTAMRTKIPNISLGTVYRNLNLLADTGEILRLQVGDKNGSFRLRYFPASPLCLQKMRCCHRSHHAKY